MKRILTWLLCFSALTATAQTLKVEGPGVVSLDETFRIVFTADGKMSDFEWPGTDDFDVVWGPQKGSMSSTSIVNGKRTSSHQETVTYLLQHRHLHPCRRYGDRGKEHRYLFLPENRSSCR